MSQDVATTRAAMIADLEMVVANLDAVRAKLLEDCTANGATYTKAQEAKFEGAFMMVRGVLADELGPMLDAWRAGDQFSRRGEEIIAGGAR